MAWSGWQFSGQTDPAAHAVPPSVSPAAPGCSWRWSFPSRTGCEPPRSTAVSGHRLHPAEDLFNPFPGPLAQSIPLMPGGASVNDRVSCVNHSCRLASTSCAGSPPRPDPVAGQRRSGSWGRQTPRLRSGARPSRLPRRWTWSWRRCAPTPRRPVSRDVDTWYHRGLTE